MASNTMDLTQGKPIRQILRFSAPLVLGTLFQQLYSFVDTVMVGRILGQDALAAVGATYALHFLVLGQDAPEAAAYSVQYLGIISCLFCIHGALMIMRNTLQGMGYSFRAVLSGVGELLGRTLGGVLSAAFGFVGICFANPLAWALALAYCTVLVRHYLKKRLETASVSE